MLFLFIVFVLIVTNIQFLLKEYLMVTHNRRSRVFSSRAIGFASASQAERLA